MFLAESTYICMGQCPDDHWIQLMHACNGLAWEFATASGQIASRPSADRLIVLVSSNRNRMQEVWSAQLILHRVKVERRRGEAAVWELRNRQDLAIMACGGSHSSWQGTKRNLKHTEPIKKQIYLWRSSFTYNLHDAQPLKVSSHAENIQCLSIIPSAKKPLSLADAR